MAPRVGEPAVSLRLRLAGVPSRLAELGVDLQLLGFREFFPGCASQNLVALLCPRCSVGHEDIEGSWRYVEQFGAGVRFTNSQGCDACSGGVIGQTVVAQVYPLLDDDAGSAYKYIRRGEFGRLDEYMRREHDVEDKHDIAAERIVRGEIDPADATRRIGLFGRDKYPGAQRGASRTPMLKRAG